VRVTHNSSLGHAEDPTTLVEYLALLCRRHHRAVHEEGYQVERDSDGELRFPESGWAGSCPQCRLRLRWPSDPTEALARRANVAEGGSWFTRAGRCLTGLESGLTSGYGYRLSLHPLAASSSYAEKAIDTLAP